MPTSARRGALFGAPRAAVVGGAVLVAVASVVPLGSPPPSSTYATAAERTAATQAPTTVWVDVDGEIVPVQVETTLARALADAGILVGPDDQVSAPMSGPAPASRAATITRATTELVTEQEALEHGVAEVPDPDLPAGERRVEREGIDGLLERVFQVSRLGGREARREELLTVETPPVDEEVAVGSKPPLAPAPVVAPQEPTVLTPVPTPDPAPEHVVTETPPAPAPDPASIKAVAAAMVADRGWGPEEFTCLDQLWERESNWRYTAENPSSGAYGIPQSLPAPKMAAAGPDWRTNPVTQVRWGLDYIAGRYGAPCGAWAHSERVGWY